MSSIEWIGQHYRIIGQPAAPHTERHWRALRPWAGRVGEKVPRTGPVDRPGWEISAFPAALAPIKSGRPSREPARLTATDDSHITAGR